jgi:hypothetical protein
MKKITDTMRMSFLADCTVAQGDEIFRRQFNDTQKNETPPLPALRRAIDSVHMRWCAGFCPAVMRPAQ